MAQLGRSHGEYSFLIRHPRATTRGSNGALPACWESLLDCRVKPGIDEGEEERSNMLRPQHVGGRAVNNANQALQAKHMSILPLSHKGRGLSATVLGAIAAKSFGGKGEGARLPARNVVATPTLSPQRGGRNMGSSAVSVPHAYVVPREIGASRFRRYLLTMHQCQRYLVRPATTPPVVGMTILETDIHNHNQKPKRGLVNEFVREVCVTCCASCGRAG